MPKRHNRDEWLQDAAGGQRNTVFPDTTQNEARFWRNLGKGPPRASTKAGLTILAISVYGFIAAILVAAYKEGVVWAFTLSFILFWGPVFGVVAWATHRSLRNLQNRRHSSRTRKH
jgi:hypothetical protein